MPLRAIKISAPIKNVAHLEFPSQDLMARTFIRFQEYYESPKFKGKVFTLEEFKKWYVEARGAFTYAADWPGFNIPSEALRPFQEGRFDPLSPEETAFLKIFKDKSEPFYIIGTSPENGEEYINHELAHALFYVDQEYKEKVLEIIKSIKDLGALKRIISHEAAGYHDSVILDEIQAHIIANFDELIREGIDQEEFAPIQKKLLNVFSGHYNRAQLNK